MEKLQVENLKTGRGSGAAQSFLVTNKRGARFRVEGVHDQSGIWTCQCRTFFDGMRTGSAIFCEHIKACLNTKDVMDRSTPKKSKPKNTVRKIDVIPSISACTKCGTTKSVLAGTNKGKQMYKCESCNRRYIFSEPGFEKNHYPPEIISEALNMVMSGMSFRKSSEHIQYTDNLKIPHNTIGNWVRKYTVIIKAYVDALEPIVGRVLSVDEAYVNVKDSTRLAGKGRGDWLWTAIDPKTRLVLATMISADSRTIETASAILRKAIEVAGIPDYVVSNSLRAYDKACYRVTTKSAHIKTKSIKYGFTNMSIERYHNEIREKLKICRGLGNDASAQIFCDLLRIHHNFIRPHMGLDGRTPAEAAGIMTPTAAQGKYRTLINNSSRQGRMVAQSLERFAENVSVVSDGDVRVVPEMWLEIRDWTELNRLLTSLGFVWFFSRIARYWVLFENTPEMIGMNVADRGRRTPV